MSDVTYAHSPGHSSPTMDDTTYLSGILKRTSWGAVIAGAVTAISLQLLFSVLGIALGTTTGDMTATFSSTPDKIGIVGGLWWLGTGTISLFIGGCVVGRFSGMVRSPDVLLHALVMWSVTAIFGFFVLSGVGVGLGDAFASQMAGTNRSPLGQFAMSAQQRTHGDGSRVILTTDSASPDDQVPTTTLDQEDAEAARRIVRNAAWWTMVALLVGIGVSLGGAWSTAPHRIVVRPASAQDSTIHPVRHG